MNIVIQNSIAKYYNVFLFHICTPEYRRIQKNTEEYSLILLYTVNNIDKQLTTYKYRIIFLNTS